MLQKTADHPLSPNITFDFSGPMCEQILHIAKNSCVPDDIPVFPAMMSSRGN